MELEAIVPLVQENVESSCSEFTGLPIPMWFRPDLEFCLVVMVGGGLLVALPAALVVAGSLPLDPAEDDVIGQRAAMEVPGVRASKA